MNVIFGIHPTASFRKGADRRKLLDFLTMQFRESPETLVFFFEWPSFARFDVEVLKQHFPEHKDNFSCIIPDYGPEKWGDVPELYSKSLNSALRKIGQNLGKKEKINAVYFGGKDHACFRGINVPLSNRLKSRFHGRVSSQKSFLPLVYKEFRGNSAVFNAKYELKAKPMKSSRPRRPLK